MGLKAVSNSGGGGGGSGTVTSVSVVSANGLAGTVASATSTPAITLSTSITGVLKGNGTAISAATAGTDYLAPGGSPQILASWTIDGGGTLIPSGNAATLIYPFATSGTIQGWTIQCNQSSTVTVDIYKQAYSSAGIPTVSITGSVQPSVTTAFSNTGTTLTGWTTTINQNDQLTLNVLASGLAGAQRIVVQLYGVR